MTISNATFCQENCQKTCNFKKPGVCNFLCENHCNKFKEIPSKDEIKCLMVCFQLRPYSNECEVLCDRLLSEKKKKLSETVCNKSPCINDSCFKNCRLKNNEHEICETICC